MSTSKVRSPITNKRSGDQVLPPRFLDSNEIFLKIGLDCTFRFDDVLDSNKLRSSFDRLLQIGNWHQMAVRYHKNSDGKMQLHIPRLHDEDRPAVAWSYDNRQQSINEDELANRIPRPSEASRPTLHEFTDTFEKLLTRPARPTTMAQYIETDHPALSIHVVSFTDASLVTLSWNHVLFDALGRQSLLQAWQAVLEGREQDVPAFIPYEKDPIIAIAEGAKAEGLNPSDHVLYTSALSGVWWLLFIVSFIYEILVHSKEAGRTVRFPGQWVEELRNQAMDELQTTGTGDSDAFLSHGDVLLAFWCKTTMAAQKLSPRQPIQIMNVMNLRGMTEELPVPGKTAYIGNGVISATTFTTASELEQLSVSSLAARIRADLKKQRDPKQVKALVAWQYDCFKKGSRPPMTGPWNQIIFSWSNWSRAKFFDVDFSSAVTQRGLGVAGRKNRLGQPSMIMTGGHANGISLRNGGPLIGQDANGDWWLNWVMRAEAWAEVEKALQA